MKIVRIIARLNTGGPARHVVWLNAGLPKEEFNSVLIAGTVPKGEGDMSFFAEQNGVKPLIIPEMSRELSPKDAISLWKVYRQLLKEKPDIIHTHTAKAGTVGRTAGLLYRWLTVGTLIGKPRQVRLIHTYHGHVFHSYYGKLKTKLFLAIEKTLAVLATHRIVVLSEQQKNEINQGFGVGRDNQFVIVPLGIDLAPFADWKNRKNLLRDELGLAEDVILVGLVGRLAEVKNIELFLRVAVLFNEKKTFDLDKIRFLIIGDGHLRESLENRANELKVNNLVKFLGERHDPEVFYPALDIIGLTSLNEGTPLSLIEAMANGRAVISTAVGGVIDLLGTPQANETDYQIAERGVLVESNDAEGFFAGLSLLINNPQLRAQLGENGEDFVKRSYSKDRLLRDVENLYRSLLNLTH
jgi:glycosyltransferase involved in cell wall biosynthesis